MMETYSSMGLVMACMFRGSFPFVSPMLLMCFCCCDLYVFVVCEFGVESQS